MIVIEVNNSYSQIKGLDPSQFKALRKVLSYVSNPEASYYTGGFIRTSYLLDKHGFFPTGLLNRVKGLLCDFGPYSIKDLRIKPNASPWAFMVDLKGIQPYPSQLTAVDKAVKAGRAGLVLPTGSGKSLIIGLITARLNVKTLVIVPNLSIKNQLTAVLDELLLSDPDIVVENIDSSRLPDLKDFGCLIIDECHHAAAKTYQVLNKKTWNDIYYRFFLTGTFFRNQENEQLLFEGICGEEVYRLTYSDAVKSGCIVPVEAYYFDLPKQETTAFTYAEVYSELVVNNEVRNKIIAETILNLTASGKKVLCLVKEIKHGEILSGLTGVSFANGQDEAHRDNIQHFSEGRLSALIGTVGVCGEGTDTKAAEYVIIAGGGKAKSQFMQNIGRGVRRYPGKNSAKVVLFRDASHKFLLRHFRIQTNILKEEYGIKIKTITRRKYGG